MAKAQSGAGAKFVTGVGRRIVALSLVPLSAMLASCGGGGGSGPGETGSGADLIVLAATPTNGQETLTNLGDPGLDGRMTVKFTDVPQRTSLIDPTNAFNGLTPNVQFLDQNFARVPGTPSLDPSTRSFTFTPAGGTLVNAQYTLTISKFVSSSAGKRLNLGLDDFSTSFTVGQDVYPPVVRNTTPAPLQNDVPLFNDIVVTFNESLDTASVVLGQTVFIEDGGTNPPTPVNGTLQLKREGFDLVFSPDPCVGMPPATTVVVRMLGVGNTSFIRDRVNNGLQGDPTNNNEVSFQFNTKGVKPLPIPANVPQPGTSRFAGFPWTYANMIEKPPPAPFSPWQGNALYAFTSTRMHLFDAGPAVQAFLSSQGAISNPALVQQVLQFNPDGSARVNHAGAPYGGDFETRFNGPPGDAIIDWRFDGATGHSYVYVVEEANNSVAIVNTGTGKIEGRFKGVGTPKGITQTGGGGIFTSTLFVTNFGQGTVTGIPLNGFSPGIPICTAVQELSDDTSRRVFLNVGRNPAGIAANFTGAPLVALVNQGDSELELFDATTLDTAGGGSPGGGLQRTYPVGGSPADVVWAPPTNLGAFCWTTNLGSAENPDGSISLWWSGAGSAFFIFFSNTGSVLGTFADGIKTPGKPCTEFSGNGLDTFVPNVASDNIVRATITIQGGFIFSTIVPTVTGDREVGPNPTSVAFFAGRGDQQVRFGAASLAGSGQVAIWDKNSTLTPPALLPLPGVRMVISEMAH